METREFWQRALVTGKWAAFATSWAAMACGARENRDPISPINAISHIAWGDEAYKHNEVSVKYSLTGLALNAAAGISWAVVLEALLGRVAHRNAATAAGSGAFIAALAYLVDYHVVPPRLTPGFEKPLSNKSLLVIYVVLAAALAGGALAKKD